MMARPLIKLASLLWISLSLLSIVTANTGSSLSAPQSIATTSTTKNDALTSNDEWRSSLPHELRNNKGAPLHRIEMGGGVVLYLLGSSHISRTSCDDVRLLMEYARPDVLFVELCSQRVGLMLSDLPTTSESDTTINDQQQQQNEQMKNRKPSLSDKGSKLYANIQADYAKKLNVTIGGEFKQAFQSALSQQCHYWNRQQILYDPYLVEKYLLPSTTATSQHDIENDIQPRQCVIILGDRPVQITIRRAWESLGLLGKTKLILALLWSSIKQPSEKELREWMEKILNDRSGKSDLITKAMEELNKAFPTLKRVIIEERDEFMVAKIRQTAEALIHSSSDDQNPKVIVAVVGAGHCSGMLEKLLSQIDDRKSPEKILSNIVETKKRKVQNDEEVSSQVTDICQFDYSCILEGTVLTQ